MALSSKLSSFKQLSVNFLLVLSIVSQVNGCYTSIFSFGDSLADTGNCVLISPPDKPPHFAFPPYGNTYFHRPTGRCSDGRLVIDFIAQYLGLPLVPPNFGLNNGTSQNFQHGVNFAVAGATALDVSFFDKRGIHNQVTNSSLGVQLGLFKELLPSLCSSSSDCNKLVQNSLVLMGEIGGNDYNNPFFQGKSIEEIRGFVPLVVNAITSAINDLIELGAVTFLVPGNLPIGCSPAYLTKFQSSTKEDYDPSTGCLNWLNKFSEYHNEQLQIELNRIRELQPHANIIYVDYYNAAMQIYRSPNQFGFTRGALTACCGGGGPYNYNSSLNCGNPNVTSCDDPSLYFSWDGIHFTEAAYKSISEAILKVIAKLPYGETFFRHPTGRCSDGRLVVDFIAEAYGLPHLPPYLALTKGQNFQHGVNFAVSGATALDSKYFYERNIGSILWTNDSLSVQLGWFKKLKSSLCITKQDCDNYFKKSLFIVGEIGGNDYNYPFFVGGSIKQLQASVPLIVEAITKATSALIEEGAVELLVPGNLPIGCSAVYLTLFQSPDKTNYNQRNGCLKTFNAFSEYHNNQLKKALEMLRQKYPHAKIIYADYYGAAMRFFHAPQHYGFYSGTLTACCGGGGPYNFNNSARCGHTGSKACENPSSYANWDGIHLTEAAYRHIATGLINGPYTSPPLKSSPL